MISNKTPQSPSPTARPANGAAPPPAASGPGCARSNVGVLREVALLPVLILLIVVGTLVSPAFLTVSNFAGIGQQSSALGVVVVGESLILMIGGMDLSLESTYGLAPMVAAWLIVPVAAYGEGTDLSPYLGIVVLLAVGAAVGLINGLLIVKGRLNGFIVTLGMTIVLAGLQNGIVKAQTLFNLPPAFGYLGAASIGQVPVSLIVAVIIFVLVGLFLRYQRTGRAIYAVGGNPAAARAAGHQDRPGQDRRLRGRQRARRHRRADGGGPGLGRDRPAGLRRGHHLQRLRGGGDRRGQPQGRPRQHDRRGLRRDPARHRAEHPRPRPTCRTTGSRPSTAP